MEYFKPFATFIEKNIIFRKLILSILVALIETYKKVKEIKTFEWELRVLKNMFFQTEVCFHAAKTLF